VHVGDDIKTVHKKSVELALDNTVIAMS